ncbi:MAG: uracil-DNA glycosylase [Clostridiales bacterium]|nr:uracil-DNA glycosylase [Clostridiales bacterium]
MKEERIKELIRACSKISSEKFIFGEGNLDAGLMLVGEAPGAKEIELGRPFVGQAGKNLDEFIDILKIKREDIYITNIVKIRPYKINEKTGRKSNRPPKREEIEKYKAILLKEIEIIRPDIVVTLGNHPLRAIYEDNKTTIGDLHGSALETKDNYILFPLYHPAAVIYNQKLKEVYLKDLMILKELLARKFRI